MYENSIEEFRQSKYPEENDIDIGTMHVNTYIWASSDTENEKGKR